MAPEVMMEGKSSKRSDVYAYGVLLWEVFCGTRPYFGMRDVAIVHKVVEENMRPVFPKDAPREYVELATSCWDKDEMKRPEFAEV
jgi:serine/threonine protein kinase